MGKPCNNAAMTLNGGRRRHAVPSGLMRWYRYPTDQFWRAGGMSRPKRSTARISAVVTDADEEAINRALLDDSGDDTEHEDSCEKCGDGGACVGWR